MQSPMTLGKEHKGRVRMEKEWNTIDGKDITWTQAKVNTRG